MLSGILWKFANKRKDAKTPKLPLRVFAFQLLTN